MYIHRSIALLLLACALGTQSLAHSATLPLTPTFHLAPTSTSPPLTTPISRFKGRCAKGLGVTDPSTSPVFADTVGFNWPTLDYTFPRFTLSDGPWTCYVEIVWVDTTVPRLETNRVSFTVRNSTPLNPQMQVAQMFTTGALRATIEWQDD